MKRIFESNCVIEVVFMILSEQFICYSFATRSAKDGSTKIQINVSDLFRNVQAVRKEKKFGEENKKEKLQAKENKMRNTNREMKNEYEI